MGPTSSNLETRRCDESWAHSQLRRLPVDADGARGQAGPQRRMRDAHGDGDGERRDGQGQDRSTEDKTRRVCCSGRKKDIASVWGSSRRSGSWRSSTYHCADSFEADTTRTGGSSADIPKDHFEGNAGDTIITNAPIPGIDIRLPSPVRKKAIQR